MFRSGIAFPLSRFAEPIEIQVCSHKAWQIGGQHRRTNKEKDEPGNFYLCLLSLAPITSRRSAHVPGSHQGDRDDPKRTRELYGRADSECLRAILRCCSHHRRGIVNCQGRPKAKLILAEVQPIAGNSRSATELRRSAVPIDTDISSSFASVMGAIAAMAEPPQIAVPRVIR